MGLLNFVLSKIDYAEKRGWIPIVDFKNGRNYYFENEQDVGKYNAWENFFEQVSCYSLEEVYQSKFVVLGSISNEITTPISDLKFFDLQNQYDYWKRLCDKYIRPSAAVKKILSQMNREYGKTNGALAVKLRGTDYNPPPPGHYYQPSVEEAHAAIEEMKKKWRVDKVFLSTEDTSIQKRLLNEFGEDLICLPEEKEKDIHKKSVIKEGQLYLAELLFLAQCPYVVGGINGGLLGIALFGKEIKDLKTWHMGKAR